MKKLIDIIKNPLKLRIVIIFIVIILSLLFFQAVGEFFLGQKGKSSSQQIVNLECDPLTLVSLKEYAENSNGVKPVYGEKCRFEDGFLMKLIYENYQQTLKAKLGLVSATEGEKKRIDELDWIIKDKNSSLFLTEGNRLGILVLLGETGKSKVKNYLELGRKLLQQERTISANDSSDNCKKINFEEDWNRYNLTKNNAECTDFIEEANGNNIKVKCQLPQAEWRTYFVKELETNSAKNIVVKADLKLIDYAKFFEESGGVGVKSDDYVDLLVVREDVRPGLESECNRTVTEEEWGKLCLLNKTSSAILEHCGVPKFTESQSCNFQVKTDNFKKIYLVFQVADAWQADVEGSLANFEICYE